MHLLLISSSLAEASQGDTLSVSSQREEVCARLLVRIGDQTEVGVEHFYYSQCPIMSRALTGHWKLSVCFFSVGQTAAGVLPWLRAD